MTGPIPDDLTQALADRYRLERELGAGGMGTVYLAHDLRHRRSVAVKVFRPELARTVGPDRFLREIQLAAQLHHPHIVSLIDSGEAAGCLYYLMPFVDGETLRARLRREGPLPIDAALHLTREVADALGYAHRRGVIHRDIKPENILLADGHAFVADFGIARALDTASAALTQTGFALGTPAYMAPEQAVGDKAVDGRADLYALGCVLYEMLTGQPPYQGATQQAILVKRFTDPVPRVRARRAEVPEWLDDLLVRTLAKDPAERPPDASTLTIALAEWHTPSSVRTAAVVRQADQEWSVVVLPFANQSPDPADAFLGDGVTDELITDLSRVKGLRVISRASAMRLKGTTDPPAAIAQRLKVRYLLDGTVRRVGDTLQLTAQLVDSETDTTIWADKFRGTGSALFDLQAALGTAVIEALAVTPAESSSGGRRFDDAAAYECYLRARQELWHWTEDSLKRAQRLLEQGLAASPDHPRLLGVLGYVRLQFVNLGVDRAALDDVRRILATLEKVAPTSAAVHNLAAGVAAFANEVDPFAMARHYLASLAIDPNDSETLMGAIVNLPVLVPPSVVRSLNRLPDVDPFTPINHAFGAWLDALEGHPTTGLASAREAYRIAPDQPLNSWYLGVQILRQCRLDQEAAEVLETTERLTRDDITSWTARLVRLAVGADRAAVANAIGERWAGQARHDLVAAWLVAGACATAGLLDEAMDWLGTAVRRGFVNYPFLARFDPTLEPLRTRADFHALMAEARRQYEAAIAEFVPPADQPHHYAEVARAAAALPKSAKRRTPAVAADATPSIAVLPFANLSADPENEYFSDGISEELINALAHIPGLRVIARTSSFAFKGRNVDVREVARALGVTAVLEGSVRKAGIQLRVTAQLVDAADGSHRWSERFDRRLEDVFAIQDEITAAISAAVGSALTGGSGGTGRQTDDATYDLYLRGKALINRGSVGFSEGYRLLEAAHRRDPAFVPAMESLGDALCIATWWAMIPGREGWSQIGALADQIARLAPDATAALRLRAVAMAGSRRDFRATAEAIRRVLARNPNDVIAHGTLAYSLIALGERTEAVRHIERVLALDPLGPVTNVIGSNAWALAGRFDDAEQTAAAAIRLDPRYPEGYHMRGLVRVYTGRFEEAEADLIRVPGLGNPSPWPLAKRCAALAGQGRFGEIREILAGVMTRRATEFMTADAIACIYGLLGERDEAFRWLDTALDEQAFWLGYLGVEPLYAPLRADPRFAAFCARANLPVQPLLPTALDRLVPPPAPAVSTPSPAQPSIAVLPFANMSGDPENEYFSDGMAEELIGALTRFGNLKVIARTSSFSFKGKNVDVREIGRTLGVTSVLEGSVRRAGNQIRVTAQLIDVTDGSQKWSERFDRRVEDVFAIQDEIAEAIRVGVGAKLLGAGRRAARHETDPETYALYLQGLHYQTREAERGTDAQRCFRQVIDRDPQFAPALARLARTLTFQHFYWATPAGEVMPAARDLARRALAIDPDLGLAEAVLGEVASWYDHDWPTAARHMARALELDPGDSFVQMVAGFVAGIRGERAQCAAAAAQMARLDPLNPAALVYAAILFLTARDYATALQVAERAFDADPHYWDAERNFGWCLLVHGRRLEAESRLAHAVAASEAHPFARVMHVHTQDRAAARTLADELAARWNGGEPGFAFLVAMAMGIAGNADEAIRWLERAAERREFWVAMVGVSEAFDSLRAHPGLEAFCRRHGLPAYVADGPDTRWWQPADHPARPSTEERPSLVVLPFVNTSPDPDTDYFADGLTEEVIADLSNIRALKVIARSSAMRLKGTDKAARTLGTDLGVRYVLAGSVRRAGQQLRITAQLADATTDTQVWAGKYNGTVDDVFDLQERLAREIAATLSITLTADDQARFERRPHPDLPVYECYQRARHDIYKFSAEATDRAIRATKAAIATLGDHELLLAALGHASLNRMFLGGDEAECLAEADRCAATIRTRWPDSSAGRLLTGIIAYRRGDAQGVVQALRPLVAAEPHHAEALMYLAVGYFLVGRTDQAMHHVTAAVELDRGNPIAHNLVGTVHYYAGRLEDSLAHYRRGTELETDSTLCRACTTMALLATGRPAEAERLAGSLQQQHPGDLFATLAGALLAASQGDRAAAVAALGQVETAARGDEGACHMMAAAFALSGEADRAVEWLSHMARARGLVAYRFFAEHDPLLASIRHTPGFAAVIAVMKERYDDFGGAGL